VKLLYVDHGNVVNEGHMYKYYGDLVRELAGLAEVFLYQGPPSTLESFLSDARHEVDCLIFGLGYFAQGDPAAFDEIEGLSDIGVPVVCMIHKQQTLLEEKLNFCKINNVDLLVDSQSTYKEFGDVAGTRSIRLPFTASPEYFYPRETPKIYDIGFCGALHGNGKIAGPTSDLRSRALEELQKKDFEVYWNASNTLDYRIHSVEEYATKISQSKVWLATTGPVLDVSPRYFEVMMSKTLLFCNKMDEQYGDFFIDGENCVMFENDLSNFNEKLDYYVKNGQRRLDIVENAYNTAINNYTWRHMAVRLLNTIEEIRDEQV